MLKELSKLINNIREVRVRTERIVRDETTRLERLYEYIEHTVSDKQVRAKKTEFIEIEVSREYRRISEIYGIDSSSRVIDTPYVFIAIGSSTAINRFKGYVIDYPNIYHVLSGREIDYKYMVVIPEVSGCPVELFKETDKLGITNKNPAGKTYSPRYNKYVVLDELRLSLENRVLESLLEDENLVNAYILIDGPIYYTPPLIYQVNELHGVIDELVDTYIEAWKLLVSKRLEIIDKLYVEKNSIVIGIVKRLYRSNILSRIDPLGISSGKMNDEAYLSIASTIRYRNKQPKPYYIGPIIYDPNTYVADLPEKKLYYIGIPRRSIVGKTDYRNYMFYRVETIHGEDDVLEPVIYDSFLSGSILPLSILLADNRAKKITSGIANYVLRVTNLSSEQTYQYITF